MTHSENATKLVQGFEDCRLSAYKDGNGIWTIGYGHTGPAVVEGLTCTQAMADEWLNQDLAVADAAIARLVKMALNQNQYDALVSLIFNIGQGHFATSTCLRQLNQGNAVAACQAMGMWNMVAGQVSDGLVRRRAAEQKLFMTKVVTG
jgi:lysozyme